jgi:hypothetical protein
MANIRERISAMLEQPMQDALDFAGQQPVVYVDETVDPSGMRMEAIPIANAAGRG